MTKRDAMTPARRARILATTGGRCKRPGCEALAVEIDHVVPLALAADEEHRKRLEADRNLEPLCGPHHALKTKSDQAIIARAKRLAGETCAGPSKRPLKGGRGFPPPGARKLASRPFRQR